MLRLFIGARVDLVRVTKPSGRSNTFINYFAKPLDCRAIITRRHNFSSTSRKRIEKKIISTKRISTYSIFLFVPNVKRFLVPSIRCWMKRIPIPVYLINCTKFISTRFGEKPRSIQCPLVKK